MRLKISVEHGENVVDEYVDVNDSFFEMQGAGVTMPTSLTKEKLAHRVRDMLEKGGIVVVREGQEPFLVPTRVIVRVEMIDPTSA